MNFKDLRKKLFEEKVSEEFENKVFQAALPELQKNKKRSIKRFSWALIPTLCLAVVIVTHLKRQIKIEPTIEMMSVADQELYENLDLIEDLDVLESMDDSTMGSSI